MVCFTRVGRRKTITMFSDNLINAVDGFSTAIKTTVEDYQFAIDAIEHFVNHIEEIQIREHQIRILSIKHFTLGLTYSEFKRLNEL